MGTANTAATLDAWVRYAEDLTKTGVQPMPLEEWREIAAAIGGDTPADEPRSRCDLCGEPADDEMAEMYDPEWPADHPSAYCHFGCGVHFGYQIA